MDATPITFIHPARSFDLSESMGVGSTAAAVASTLAMPFMRRTTAKEGSARREQDLCSTAQTLSVDITRAFLTIHFRG